MEHQAIATVKQRMLDDVIGGAADTAIEMIQALTAYIGDLEADSAAEYLDAYEKTSIDLIKDMQTLAPPLNALHRTIGSGEQLLKKGVSAKEMQAGLIQAGKDFLTFAETAMRNVEQYGAELVPDNGKVLMLSMSSTVWRILRLAKKNGKNFSVMGTEALPGREGLWTGTEMVKAGIPISISTDAMVGDMMAEADVVFVGADAISTTGFALCKCGTFPVALAAKYYGVPFYIAADTLKFDPCSLLGLPFRRSEVTWKEVFPEEYCKDVNIIGHHFDITPPELVTGVITEQGVIPVTSGYSIMRQFPLSERLNKVLPAWNKKQL